MPTKMTLSASVTLYRILISILYDEEGKERDLPFNVKYKLQRSRDVVTPDALAFEERRVALIKELGTKNGETYQVSDENMQTFREEAEKLLSQEVEHTFRKLTPTEVEAINIKGITCDEMDLFIACMIDDPDLMREKEVEQTVNNVDGEAVETEEEANTPTEV